MTFLALAASGRWVPSSQEGASGLRGPHIQNKKAQARGITSKNFMVDVRSGRYLR
eukprot:NODE_27986_length_493_cov_1.806011.p2 GENE.NODE_27986_length_493_cov_1.806011~~NODE_27986_length_493_cov_1.806011.p2  ORF type:complete len:55 (+),score=8.80 NODE_27986_length_493_cov_1.806011:154-318(+)